MYLNNEYFMNALRPYLQPSSEGRLKKLLTWAGLISLYKWDPAILHPIYPLYFTQTCQIGFIFPMNVFHECVRGLNTSFFSI